MDQVTDDLGTLTLEPIMVDREVTVLLEGEELHEGISVKVNLNGEEVSTGLTNREGFVRLRMFAWDQVINASIEGFEPTEWEITWDEERDTHVLSFGGESSNLGERPLELPLVPGQISGYVQKEGATSQLGALVTLSNGQTAVTGPEGQFLLPGLRAGTYELRVDEEGYVSQTRSALIVRANQETEASTAELPIQLSRERGRLVGVATRADATPAGGVLVRVVGTELSSYSDPQGNWLSLIHI